MVRRHHQMDEGEMRPDTIFFVFIMLTIIIALTFFVIFGEKTVRKLRKNPKTKDSLGIEFMSGWDILNVMMALALPKRMTRMFKKSPLAALYADIDLLEKHTTRSDCILARISSFLLLSSALALVIFMLIVEIGVFR